jgi:hypothetical protein
MDVFNLTPLEKAELQRIRQHWQDIICTEQPLNRSATRFAINAAYIWLGQSPPEIIFVDDPQAALALFNNPVKPRINRWWRLLLWIWLGLWFIPIMIGSYICSALICMICSFAVDMLAALIYWIVTWFLTYLPPPRFSPLMQEIYSFTLNIAFIVAVPIALFQVPLWIKEVNKETIGFLDSFDVFDRPFRSRYGSSLRVNFMLELLQKPYADLRRDYARDLGEHSSFTVDNYRNRLSKINQSLTEQIATATSLSRCFRKSNLIIQPYYYDYHTEKEWCNDQISDASALEFMQATNPNTIEFRQWWRVYSNLIANTYLYIPYEKVCVVVDRPGRIDQLKY